MKKSLSEAASDDLEKTRRDQATVRESLEKEYRHEIKSLNSKLISRILQFESNRALRDAVAKKCQDVTARDKKTIADLEKEIALISKLRD